MEILLFCTTQSSTQVVNQLIEESLRIKAHSKQFALAQSPSQKIFRRTDATPELGFTTGFEKSSLEALDAFCEDLSQKEHSVSLEERRENEAEYNRNLVFRGYAVLDDRSTRDQTVLLRYKWAYSEPPEPGVDMDGVVTEKCWKSWRVKFWAAGYIHSVAIGCPAALFEWPPEGDRSEKFVDGEGVYWMPGLKEPGTGDPRYAYDRAYEDPLIRWTPRPVDMSVEELEDGVAEAKL